MDCLKFVVLFYYTRVQFLVVLLAHFEIGFFILQLYLIAVEQKNEFRLVFCRPFSTKFHTNICTFNTLSLVSHSVKLIENL